MSLGNLFGGFVSINDSVPTDVNYTGAGFSTKVSEVTEKLSKDFGGTASFTKLATPLPSISSLRNTTKTELADAAKRGVPLTAEEKQQIIGMFAQDAPDTYSASQINQLSGSNGAKSAHQVFLTERGFEENTIIFEVMPEITENRNVDYEAIAPAQFPGAFQKYKGTQSTTWNVNVKFTARNTEEATRRYLQMSMLRGWTMPFFGQNTSQDFQKKLGAPPPVLKFGGWRGLVGVVPVVMTSMNWQWPSDVDYIPTSILGEDGQAIPFPTVMNIQITLVESFSSQEFNNFSLADFRQGQMTTAYSKKVSSSGDLKSYSLPISEQPKAAAIVPPRATKSAQKSKVVPKKLPTVVSEKSVSAPTNIGVDTTQAHYDEQGLFIGRW
jgi:hypothetical protein